MPSSAAPAARSPGASAALLLLCLPLLVPVPLPGQSAVVAADENFRAEPNGEILGRLNEGTRLRVEGSQGGWTRVTAEGVVFIPSLQVHRDGGFDLIVSAAEGENLRDEPAGRIAGHFERGTLLEELERMPGWIRVRRTGWIWTPSIRAEEASPAVPQEPPAQAPAAPPAAEWLRAGPGGAPILTSPDGDTLAAARPGAELPVLGRDGNWARVRVEGWVWVPGAAPEDAGDVVLRDVRASELAGDPERYRGRVVEMELQFISLERAERIRTDFHEGEPFLLTRAADAERTFVYVAVPPERVEEVGRLAPLERIRVVGRVRAGAAALTGNPVLELVDLRPLR